MGNIRSGDILTVKIIENNNGLIKASLLGKTMLLKGPDNLQVDSVHRVKALWNTEILQLNLLDSKSRVSELFDMSASLKGASDHFASMLFAAAKRAGLHLKDENVNILKRLIRKKTNLDVEKSRIASEAVKKGLSPDELLMIFEGTDSESENRQNKEKTLLFNHLKSNDELWFVVPYNFSGGFSETESSDQDLSLNGSIRIRKEMKTGKISLAVIETRIENKRIYFMIKDFNNKHAAMKIFSDGILDKSTKKAIREELPKILGNLPIKFDDNIIEDCFEDRADGSGFDGFSYSDFSAEGVEEIV
ncbi:MAG: hypothetical protein PQJ61_03590 [Spirochaetales bacterium]|uniref:Uncharacterized protein n=1 Tax=Candidatus Thalassospirochaeta sargassi TaxID=3119039 RepID=A0AAJ1IGK3_9SPIO|nr:hypothetical protein [Spirochaetales bacterium]